MSEWISVEDRLPEFPCLTYWADGKMEAYDNFDTCDVDDLMAPENQVPLTHWMPLPDPPTES